MGVERMSGLVHYVARGFGLSEWNTVWTLHMLPNLNYKVSVVCYFHVSAGDLIGKQTNSALSFLHYSLIYMHLAEIKLYVDDGMPT